MVGDRDVYRRDRNKHDHLCLSAGIAFAKGGNFQFLQLVFGYMLGRVVISLIFIPLYFKGDLQTVYQLLGERFGSKVKMLASALFVIMRNVADGVACC
jgi:uncharacterized sodium:solute symporter family permease YidK